MEDADISDNLLNDDVPPFDDDLGIEEIEAAYLRALETADAAEVYLNSNPSPIIAEDEDSEDIEGSTPSELVPSAVAPSRVNGALNDEEDAKLDLSSDDDRVTMPQVLEALLFVGGDPLPAKRLGEVLGNVTHEQVDELVEQLNVRYQQQNRPYEICLVQGGYRMSLLPEFEAVRRKVYGQGPKEVKLAQEALEILAFIAYQQPVSQEQVLATERKNAKSILRNLLRRQLIAIDREADDAYRTTPRFLQLFGLADLEDLPQAIDFSFR